MADINITYRNIYQCRHTYASTLLSNGENIWFVATQMGHIDTEMLIKRYGHWIPQESTQGYKFKGKY
jgi:integrase